MNWSKRPPVEESPSIEWARLMKDRALAWEGGETIRKEITRRVGQHSPMPDDMLVRIYAADRRIEQERKRVADFGAKLEKVRQQLARLP